MASAAFTINGSASPQSCAAGSTVTLALTSTTGAGTIVWSIIGSSDSTKTAPTITPAGSPSGATATFTMNTPVGATGLTWLVQCVINGGVDSAGQAVAAYTATGLVGVVNSPGFLPFTYGELLQRNSTTGIADDLNAQLGKSRSRLSNVLFVDAASTAASPDGSMGAPFATLTSAIAAAAALGNSAHGVLLVAPGDYSGESPISWTPAGSPGSTLAIRGLDDSYAGVNTLLPDITVGAGTGSGLALANVTVTLDGTGDTYAENCAITGAFNAEGGSSLTMLGGVFGGSGGALDLTDTSVSHITDCASLFMDGREITDSGTIVSCSGTSVELRNVEVPSASTIVFTGSAGTLKVDATSNYFFKQGSETLTNGAKVITADTTA